MNKLLISLVGSLALSATLPALAGPDWQAIEHGRQAKQANQPDSQTDGAAGRSAAALTCPSKRPALLLDHGPRAQTTPYVNQCCLPL